MRHMTCTIHDTDYAFPDKIPDGAYVQCPLCLQEDNKGLRKKLSDAELRCQTLLSAIKIDHEAIQTGDKPEPQDRAVPRMLEDLQDRACRGGLPIPLGLAKFTDYLRSLYPEYYALSKPCEHPNSQFVWKTNRGPRGYLHWCPDCEHHILKKGEDMGEKS